MKDFKLIYKKIYLAILGIIALIFFMNFIRTSQLLVSGVENIKNDSNLAKTEYFVCDFSKNLSATKNNAHKKTISIASVLDYENNYQIKSGRQSFKSQFLTDTNELDISNPNIKSKKSSIINFPKLQSYKEIRSDVLLI